LLRINEGVYSGTHPHVLVGDGGEAALRKNGGRFGAYNGFDGDFTKSGMREKKGD
jgi:hypothetical protein